MTFYSIVLFLHIVGALGLFVALGLEWISLLSLRRVGTIEPAREWLRVFGLVRWVGPISMGLLLLSGAHMMRGRSAERILLGLLRAELVSQLSHAGYLGAELAKAEAALRLNLVYEQDQPLRTR